MAFGKKRAAKKEVVVATDSSPPQPHPWGRIDETLIAQIKAGEVKHVFSQDMTTPPPGVLPQGHSPRLASRMAMDSGNLSVNQWATQQVLNVGFFEGTIFLGFTYLSQLAQRAEYRRPSETLATEMTRKWIELKSKSGDKGKQERIRQVLSEMERLNVRDSFRKVAEYDGFMGRMHLYLDTGDTNDKDELKTDIGSGSCSTTKMKFADSKGYLRALRPVEPVWCYPAAYDSNDPLSKDWYNPATWFVMAKELHRSRLLLFVGREVPDLLKPSYAFGGLSLSQMAKPTVDNWLRTRQSVADMLWTYSITVIKTNLFSRLQQGGAALMSRIRLFASTRTNQGVMMVDKEAEDITNISAPLSTLDHLQAQAQEHMCSVLGEPVVKLLGIQPSGLNATAEGELRTWYDHVAAHQEKFYRPNLTVVIDHIQMSLWGEVDKDIVFEFIPLMELSESEQATLRKTEADTAVELIQAGVLDPMEERKRMSADAESPYSEIDPDQAPTPPPQPGAEGQGPMAAMAGGAAPPGQEQDSAGPAQGELDLSTIAGKLGVMRPADDRRDLDPVSGERTGRGERRVPRPARTFEGVS